jgi:ribA/ribD-fused uncharacterized protein
MQSICPSNVSDLCTRFNSGEAFVFLHFWGHRPRADGRPSNSCFSQWFESSFKVDGTHYATAEHYMMAEKARLFGDKDTFERILQATNPGAAKNLGRQVRGYDETAWVAHRFDAVVRGNYAKFNQNTELKTYLLSTGTQILVEASPVDPVWGIGLAKDDPLVANPNTWQGLNLLGFALIEVRSQLK